MIWHLETNSEEQTRRLGESMGKHAAAGDVYALSGELGTGKTVFAKGFAAGLGVRETVISPTFTILQIYESGRLPFYHMDVYRLEDEDELEAVGGTEFLYGNGVSLVEWAERVRGLLPENTVFVAIAKDLSRGTDYRAFTVKFADPARGGGEEPSGAEGPSGAAGGAFEAEEEQRRRGQ